MKEKESPDHNEFKTKELSTIFEHLVPDFTPDSIRTDDEKQLNSAFESLVNELQSKTRVVRRHAHRFSLFERRNLSEFISGRIGFCESSLKNLGEQISTADRNLDNIYKEIELTEKHLEETKKKAAGMEKNHSFLCRCEKALEMISNYWQDAKEIVQTD